MCVIVHKERGKDLPSEENLEKCFNRNPHGSGILLHRHDTKLLEIHKGFMKFADFKTAFNELNVQKEDDLVLHFRITTSGGTSPENCHPFPITNKVEDLKATRINTKKAFVHNGVLGAGDETVKISDTQVFVRDILSRQEISDHLEDDTINKVITEMAGSGQRFFVADAEKDIFQRYGVWYEDDGLWYSNLTWKTPKVTYTTNYSRGTGGYYGGYSGYSDYYDASWYGNYNKPAKKEQLPDINSCLCPWCDKQMKPLLEGQEIFICPDCGTIYNDKTFEIYDKKNSQWISIADINDFDSALAS